MKPEDKADWMAIVLHFAVGFIVGAGALLLGFCRHGNLFKTAGTHVIILIAGGGIISGAFYGLYQNEIWLKNSGSIIPPIPPQHSKFSRILLVVLMIVAGLGMAAAFYFLKAIR